MSSKFSKVFCLLLVANGIFLAAGSLVLSFFHSYIISNNIFFFLQWKTYFFSLKKQSFGKIIATCVQKLDYSVDKLKDMAETKTDEDGCFVGCIMAEYGTVSTSDHLSSMPKIILTLNYNPFFHRLINPVNWWKLALKWWWNKFQIQL